MKPDPMQLANNRLSFGSQAPVSIDGIAPFVLETTEWLAIAGVEARRYYQ